MAFQRKNRESIITAIQSRTPFQHASMSGKWISDRTYIDWGQLQYHPESIETMRVLLNKTDLYVIFSYQTPIAYAYDREIHEFPHKYSVTTTHHQSIVKSAKSPTRS